MDDVFAANVKGTTVVNVDSVQEQVTTAAPLKKSEYNCSISHYLNLINYCVKNAMSPVNVAKTGI